MHTRHQPGIWACADRVLDLTARPLIMGILNVTPDSFSDGGRFLQTEAAVARGLQMLEAGADILDIGGESTRPGAEPVSADEEAARVIPVIEALRVRRDDALLSVDTCKAAVARAALAAGARIVNDVSACTADPAMIEIVRAGGAGVVLMHMRGTPRTMQDDPQYDDVVAEVGQYLEARAAALEAGGVARERIAVDPGIGFGKTLAHNLRLLARLDTLLARGRPVVVGLSRKRFLGLLTERGVEQRLAGSLAGLCWCVSHGVQVMRVHDVEESRDAARVVAALRRESAGAN